MELSRRQFHSIGLGAMLSPLVCSARSLADKLESGWTYLDNGTLRLGVDRGSGACVGYLAQSDRPNFNYLNHYDRGRFVQQSYYGDADGSMWDKKPWRWNPVQGGDWRGKPAQVLSFTSEQTSLASKSVAVHWGSGEELKDVTFEQAIRLEGPLVQISFAMSYKGSVSHGARPQELPAVFVDRSLRHLAVYQKDKAWTDDALDVSMPGWPNESRKFTEHWAAYLDDQHVGIGAYVPAADRLTCYRFGDGSHESHCSYLAPLKTFAITPGLRFVYDVYLTLGTLQEIRDRLSALATPK